MGNLGTEKSKKKVAATPNVAAATPNVAPIQVAMRKEMAGSLTEPTALTLGCLRTRFPCTKCRAAGSHKNL
jgi:hypothetical protein